MNTHNNVYCCENLLIWHFIHWRWGGEGTEEKSLQKPKVHGICFLHYTFFEIPSLRFSIFSSMFSFSGKRQHEPTNVLFHLLALFHVLQLTIQSQCDTTLSYVAIHVHYEKIKNIGGRTHHIWHNRYDTKILDLIGHS